MALTRVLFSSLLLSSLLVISSANYNYDQYTSNYAEHDNKQTLLNHGQLHDNNLIPNDISDNYDHDHDDKQKLLPDPLADINILAPSKPDDHYQQHYYHQKSEGKDSYVPSEPAEYYKKSKPAEGKEYNVPTKLPYNIGGPNKFDQVHQSYIPEPIKYIAIRGVVLCNSGQSYAPLPGAKARITCEAKEGKNGYGKSATPFSIVTDVTDQNGFFFKALPLSYVHQLKLNLDECKVYLEAPSSDCNCKVATDVNYGKSGAHLSSVDRVLDDKFLYTVGPFIYTSYSSPAYKPAVPKEYNSDVVPSGGY